MAMTLAKGSILEFEYNGTWYKMSEHNRSALDVTPIRIENVKRTANGTARKFFIAEKSKISASWEMLPSSTALTVDGGWGANDLRTFYKSTTGQSTFRVRLNFAELGTNNVQDPITVMFTECSFSIVKRGLQAHWNVSLTLEEQ